MNWNDHYALEGEHAFLGASNYHWLNYTASKLEAVYRNHRSKEEGIELHDFAAKAITKKLKLQKTKKTINLFVNDCIGYNMVAEKKLCYSLNAFGTADAISFKDNVLRISDLKTGYIKASFKQLDIYAALFCLEYNVNPLTIIVEHRIYQNNECVEALPTGEYIQQIMNQIVEFDSLIEILKNEI